MVFDEIGNWSEVKLDIVRDYAAAYSRIMAARTPAAFHHVYIAMRTLYQTLNVMY